MEKDIKSVYIHIPFCSNICSYCDFAKMFYNHDMVLKYLKALEKEINEKYQNELIETLYIGGGTPSCLNIDELKVGHHASKTSSSKTFIDAINPKYSIISVGKNNRYGHPNDSVLDNLEDSKIYRTDQDGSVMFKIKNNKLNVETCAP